MIYKRFKDIRLSRLGMGNMRPPIMEGGKAGDIDREKARQIIDYAMASGINYYDTAYVYHEGKSEAFLGDELVSRYPRDSFYLATKYIRINGYDYKTVFQEQLARLKTDHIDFYLIHAVMDNTCDEYLNCGCIEYFLEQQRLGRIKYLGFSSHASPKVLERFAAHHKWDFAQIQLNYYDWLYGTAKEEYIVLEKLNIPIMVMETVRGGRLSKLTEDAEKILQAVQPKWTTTEWAFRFVKSLNQVQLALSGMSTLEQIKENVATYKDYRGLQGDEIGKLFSACNSFRKQVHTPCTACRYCCDDCPAKINIPAVLAVYNDYKLEGRWALGKLKSIDSQGKPQDCIECGACKSHCPQSIDITGIMAELKDILPVK
ncbi:MAG: aldo/keto reductase [Eubacteriales bacterium]|nr:aldo/keto reductase [Eubacteriales bacterium]